MKLDKRHLVVSLVLLIGSIVYNVWVFTRPAGGASAAASAPAGIGAVPQAATDGAVSGTASIDPTQVLPLADVALDQPPAWPRDPFASLRAPAPAPIVDAAAPEPVVEPDLVVASILYSSDRRLAMIGGRVARVGDVIDGVRIVEILPNAVIVESPSKGRRTLSVRAGSSVGSRR